MTETRSICKICGGPAPVFTCVDFEKHCNQQLEEARFAGIEVAYYRCEGCHFIFTPFLDSFSPEELVARVYNDDYVKFDPLYPAIRPRMNADFLRSILGETLRGRHDLRILDYGAGNGLLGELMGEATAVESYDALNPRFNQLPEGRFDLIFCSEVVEHIPDPHALMADWAKLLKHPGAVIFSTTLQPDDIASQRGGWWYLGPRNGHVSLFSRESLALLCEAHGLDYVAIDEQWHVAGHDLDNFLDLSRLALVTSRLPKGFIEV